MKIEYLDFISRDEWPSNSPDLNPMNYSVWSILEEKACAKPHYNFESLKRALTKAWNEIMEDCSDGPLRDLKKILELLNLEGPLNVTPKAEVKKRRNFYRNTPPRAKN